VVDGNFGYKCLAAPVSNIAQHILLEERFDCLQYIQLHMRISVAFFSSTVKSDFVTWQDDVFFFRAIL